MQVDWQEILRAVGRFCLLKPLPASPAAFVDAYIKAYYVPEGEIGDWLLQHREYSPSQLTGLLNQATHISRKTRSRLIHQLQPSNSMSSKSS